jgi:hypothetical protein
LVTLEVNGGAAAGIGQQRLQRRHRRRHLPLWSWEGSTRGGGGGGDHGRNGVFRDEVVGTRRQPRSVVVEAEVVSLAVDIVAVREGVCWWWGLCCLLISIQLLEEKKRRIKNRWLKEGEGMGG